MQQEPRLGRWGRLPAARNGVAVQSLKLSWDEVHGFCSSSILTSHELRNFMEKHSFVFQWPINLFKFTKHIDFCTIIFIPRGRGKREYYVKMKEPSTYLMKKKLFWWGVLNSWYSYRALFTSLEVNWL